MADRTAISWTEATWNPWYGCTKVSAGCDNCYMFREMRQYGRDPETVMRRKTTFAAPLRWREPRRIFACSWSDWFIAEADAWRPEAWAIIRQTPHLTFQILTKRPARIRAHLPEGWPWPHVWLGTSVESAASAYRARVLQDVPAALRFLSLEPLLGPLPQLDLAGIGWAILGGESGPGYRPIVGDTEVPVFTARLLFESQPNGTKYTAIVKHKDTADAKKHADMGFHDGWGAATEQLIAHAKTLGT